VCFTRTGKGSKSQVTMIVSAGFNLVMDTVYFETTVIGNIAGRMHSDSIIATRQSVSRRWWATAGQEYRLLASTLVIEECSSGDPTTAVERMAVIAGVELLTTSEAVDSLADALKAQGARRVSHRDCGGERRRISGNMELQTHRESDTARSNRVGLPKPRIRTTGDLHTGTIVGGKP